MDEEEPLKTYAEIVEEKPIELSLSLLGYSQADIEALRDFFGFRRVCDNDRFEKFYIRKARSIFQKYSTQLRLETVDKNLNPFFDNYSERYIQNGGQDEKTPAGKTESIKPAEITKKITPIETKETKQYADFTSELSAGIKNVRSGNIKTKESGSYFDESEGDSDRKGLLKANPMSSTPATIGIGKADAQEINGLDWTSSSQQDQATQKDYKKVTHDASGNPTTEESYNNLTDAREGKDTTTVTYQNDEIVKKEKLGDGVEKLTVNTAGENKLTYDGHEISEYGHWIKYQQKGRSNLTPQKALTEAMTYLRDISPAFMWLTEELEPCFLGVYDYD